MGLIGFGLDYKYNELYPGTIAGLIKAYREHLSHLSIVSLLKENEAMVFKKLAGNLPIVHHLSNISPASPNGPDLELLARQDIISRKLDAVWCCEDIGIWNIGPLSIPYFVPPLFDSEVATYTAENIRKVCSHSSVPFLAENPSCSFIMGSVSLETFFSQIVKTSRCKLVLDVSHVFSYALASKRSAKEVLLGLPLEEVWEIHVAGGHTNPEYPNRYIDSHSEPIMPEVIALLEEAVKNSPNLKAVTYEIGNKLAESIIREDVDKIERRLKALSWMPQCS